MRDGVFDLIERSFRPAESNRLANLMFFAALTYALLNTDPFYGNAHREGEEVEPEPEEAPEPQPQGVLDAVRDCRLALYSVLSRVL